METNWSSRSVPWMALTTFSSCRSWKNCSLPLKVGPVVIVNVSRWRCDALIVKQSGVMALELADLTAQDAMEHANRYLHTLQEAERTREQRDEARRRVRESGAMADRQAVQEAERALRAADAATDAMLMDVLDWQWQTIAEPVLTTLGFHDTPADDDVWPHLWWCPTVP